MLFPDKWTIILTTYCQTLKARYESEIFTRINAAALRPNHPAREVARFLNELDDFKRFGKEMALLQQAKGDVRDVLQPSRTRQGQPIPNFFVKRVGPWECHFYRDPLAQKATGVLLFHDRDRPLILFDALRNAFSHGDNPQDR